MADQMIEGSIKIIEDFGFSYDREVLEVLARAGLLKQGKVYHTAELEQLWDCYKKQNKENNQMAKLNVYEYVVVQRAEAASSAISSKEGKVVKDALIIGPKCIMAKDEKEVERLAIREVNNDVDISMIEVFVRPFAYR